MDINNYKWYPLENVYKKTAKDPQHLQKRLPKAPGGAQRSLLCPRRYHRLPRRPARHPFGPPVVVQLAMQKW